MNLTNEKLEKILHSSCSQGHRFVFDGIYYPKEKPYRIATDGKCLFGLRIEKDFSLKSMIQSGKINKCDADKIEALSEMEGNYPDWKQVLPVEFDVWETTVPVIASGKRNVQDLYENFIGFENGEWKIGGEHCVKVEYLRLFAGAKINIGISGVNSPIIIFPQDEEDPYSAKWFYVMMPLRSGSMKIESKHIGKFSVNKFQ